MHEDGSNSAGIRRARFGSERRNPQKTTSRQRKLSTASSPSSYKVWTADEEEEVDQYGYVLAGSPVTPDRGIHISCKNLDPGSLEHVWLIIL